MNVRIVQVIGALLLLFGSVVGGGVAYFGSSDDCRTGTVLDIRPASEPTDEDVTPFSELSVAEQRVFLEAYTNVTGVDGWSRVYAEWDQEWFRASSAYVEYRGEYFRTQVGHLDCGIDVDALLSALGRFSVYLGALVLGLATLYRTRFD